MNTKIDKIEKISCGLTHSCCVGSGKAYMWGILGQKESLVFQNPSEIEF